MSLELGTVKTKRKFLTAGQIEVTITLENRKFLRIPLLGLKVFSRSVGELIGKSRDITPYGMFIEAENLLEPGIKILLEFKLPGQGIPIKAYGEVKWVRRSPTSEEEPSGMGVQFINISEADKRKLEEYAGEQFKGKINSDNYTLADFINISE